MLEFVSFLGGLLMLATLVGYLLRNRINQPIMNIFKESRKVLILIGVGAFFFLSNQLFFYARFGHQYYLVYPTGGWSTVFSSGIKFRWFAAIQEWQKEIDIKVVGDNEPTEGLEGIIRDKVAFQSSGSKGEDKQETIPGIAITFIDRVGAAVQISVRMKMPEDPETFRALAESFRNPQNLINNTLIPTIKEQISNTGYMFAAQDYISGAATDFRQAVDDQLKYGGYSTERREYYDTIYSAIQEAGTRTIKEINTRYRIIRKTDKDGKLIRIPHEITKNKVIVTQVIVDEVYPEPAFKKRLEAQRDISAQKRIEMEKIETARAEQQRIIAEGERDKAKERVDQEKEQVKQLIAIETQLKQENTRKQLAEIALQTARLESEQNLVRERAQAEANRLKVAAGLTPQERANLQRDVAIGVAEKLSTLKLPQVYIEGGGKDGKNNMGLIESLLGAEIAKTMIPALKSEK
ncbi:MAG TPA: SPFH domain-containing protein [Cyclobacteriaceae bacterium]|nr:SPFH domain-containing protein [Cyclobacteriaceae bacterium]